MSDKSDKSDDADAAAIEATLQTVAEAFRARSTEGLGAAYAEDADWTNAFGTTLNGRAAIVDYLAGLFRDPKFTAGRLKGAPTVEVRQVRPDVVVARTYLEIEGQETLEGRIPVRRNFSMKVLAREGDGAWRIVSDLYMDAREETTYRGT
jgi:uncharacterized protein (TIGR02246 family)